MSGERTLRRVVAASTSGEIVRPALQTLLFNPGFRAFEVPMGDFENRQPDGWFHPSEHPLWDPLKLYWYLTAPERLVGEPPDPMMTMAVTQGNFWHSFFQNILFQAGMVRDCNPNERLVHDRVEKAVVDEVAGSRGHMDGVLNSDVLPLSEDEGLEIKTMRTIKAASCPKVDAVDPAKTQWLATKCPEYYLQAQEYMRMGHFRVQRVIIVSLEYPFELCEIAVPYNRVLAEAVLEKYMGVRQAVADGVPPGACCAPRSKEAKQCPARSVCPIGRM